MMQSTSGSRKGLIALVSLIGICCAGCQHRDRKLSPPPPASLGATLVVEFAWVASPEDNLGSTRTVILNGRQDSTPRDSRFVSCFGATKKAGCQVIGEFSTTSSYTPGLEYDGSETINNAQLGRWEVSAAGEASAGASASQSCSVNVDSNRLVTVRITMGVDGGCSVQ